MKVWELFPKPSKKFDESLRGFHQSIIKFDESVRAFHQSNMKFDESLRAFHQSIMKFDDSLRAFPQKASRNLIKVLRTFPMHKKCLLKFEKFYPKRSNYLFFHETHQNLDRIRRPPSKKEEM